ncbi:hypothetical protein EV586_107110 [Tumebacillus sp. BK434]|uniref:hypothetical protein n=1 Tax=Tumebacillus sp. BK434 TaxID=2512169 RepID=UPI00104C620B|nr:hypothetical protein [Tumebacillus sp. BK434]TCP52867.1 hypothetical protein EV586_107110 [Tumebacillus sp. BK434]
MNLRQHAQRFVGQPIVAHHMNGTVHHGVLHSVTNEGMYIRYPGAGLAAADSKELAFKDALLQNTEDQPDVEPVFFGLGFLPWLALAGFWGGGLWW